MTTTYREADPPVLALVQRIIGKEHAHLATERIDVIFRSEHAKDAGKVVFGKARKISGLNAFMAGEEDNPFFVLELAEDIWTELTTEQQAALIDHELSHMVIKINDQQEQVIGIVGHDLEEFEAVVRRHGLWRPDVASFAKVVAEQLDLLADGEDVEPAWSLKTGTGLHVAEG